MCGRRKLFIIIFDDATLAERVYSFLFIVGTERERVCVLACARCTYKRKTVYNVNSLCAHDWKWASRRRRGRERARGVFFCRWCCLAYGIHKTSGKKVAAHNNCVLGERKRKREKSQSLEKVSTAASARVPRSHSTGEKRQIRQF